MTVFLSILCVIAIANWFTVIRLEKASHLKKYPKVSLLIPVRNERDRIFPLLNAIGEIKYPNLEKIFLDDESTDGTFELLKEKSGSDVLVNQGKALPSGWVGKSWACWQLANEASGEVLVFCDADVVMSPKSIERTVFWMQEKKVESLTVLPYQILPTWFEKAVVPFIMHIPIFALVPLRLVTVFRKPSLVVANGQWFAIEREAYFKIKGHQSCSNSVIEDMELGRNLVQAGYRVLPVLGLEDIKVRMYDSWAALQEGFTKNLFFLSGGNSVSAAIVFLGSLAIYNFPGWPGLCFLFLLRVIVALAFRASWLSIIFHPIGNLLFAFLLLRSWYRSKTHRLVWKGRLTQTGLTV